MNNKKGGLGSAGIGKTRILLNNEWTLEMFYKFPRDYLQLYSLLFACQKLRKPLDDFSTHAEEKAFKPFSIHPWMGGFSRVNFYNELFYQVPHQARPKISSIHFSSPGFIELNAVVQVATEICGIVTVVSGTLKVAESTYNKIWKGIRDRNLNKINLKKYTVSGRKRTFKISSKDNKFIHESLSIISSELKINPKILKSLEVLTGSNKLLQLKILMSAYRRIKDLAKEQKRGNITLINPKNSEEK